MSSYSFKPRLWPTVISVPILICLLLLGNWQVERLQWKLGLIEQIEGRAFMPPASLPAAPENLDELEYQAVTVSGSFNNDQEMTLYSVGPNGEAGYDLYTPFSRQDGSVIIVNRGWVPERLKNQVDRPDSLAHGEVIVDGLLRNQGQKLWYGPENEPDNNTWFYSDVSGMAAAQKLPTVYPMFLYASRLDGDNGFPVAGRTKFNIVNNHLDYALTWYGLFIVLLVIYLIAHIKKKQH